MATANTSTDVKPYVSKQQPVRKLNTDAFAASLERGAALANNYTYQPGAQCIYNVKEVAA
ncbi:hypothetical protein A0256_23415 [Mucilaginibacter sp. PAMC 26640]|nr:hypothetical protein A0256_23415 [Mucilaginibacter sp. PAMC 26640]